MEISICFADYPTETIGETSREFRQLGIGYANLGALLMATGHAYDSDGGRALAARITSLMTGVRLQALGRARRHRRARTTGYARNAEPHTRVMRKHAAASDADPQRRRASIAKLFDVADTRRGRTMSRSARRTAGATRRPRCSRPPAPSA